MSAPLTDPFGRAITYLRVSVTDRCDFRCVYCMAENMTFLPKSDLLTLEELDRLCSAFVAKGVRKLRLSGGEPLVRRGIMTLVQSLSRHLASGALDELTTAQIRRRAEGPRRQAHQRLARHPRCRQVPRHHPLGRARQGARRYRRRAGSRPAGENQCGGA
jgi:organic radical activating enzyme